VAEWSVAQPPVHAGRPGDVGADVDRRPKRSGFSGFSGSQAAHPNTWQQRQGRAESFHSPVHDFGGASPSASNPNGSRGGEPAVPESELRGPQRRAGRLQRRSGPRQVLRGSGFVSDPKPVSELGGGLARFRGPPIGRDLPCVRRERPVCFLRECRWAAAMRPFPARTVGLVALAADCATWLGSQEARR